MFVDRAFNIKGSRVSVILEGPNGLLIKQSLRFSFKISNNQVEYEALIARVNLASEMGVAQLISRSDSQLIINQVKSEFQTKDPQLSRYLSRVKTLAEAFESFDIEYIP